MYNRRQSPIGCRPILGGNQITDESLSLVHHREHAFTSLDDTHIAGLSELGLYFDELIFTPETESINVSSSQRSYSDCDSVTTVSSSPDSAAMSGDEVGVSRSGEPASHFLADLKQRQSEIPGACHIDTDKRRLLTNHRERQRMRSLNDAMDRLRNVVPHYPSKRRLSKMETLLLAQSYIMALSSLLQDKGSSEEGGDDRITVHNITKSLMKKNAPFPSFKLTDKS